MIAFEHVTVAAECFAVEVEDTAGRVIAVVANAPHPEMRITVAEANVKRGLVIAVFVGGSRTGVGGQPDIGRDIGVGVDGRSKLFSRARQRRR